MKKLILFITLLLSITIHAQRYNDFAELLFTRMTTQPSTAEKQWISEAFDSMQYYNLIQKFDWLYIHAAHEESAAYLNWVNNTWNGTEAGGSLVFKEDTCIISDGTSYLNTGYKPSTGGVHYKTTGACFAVYIRNELAYDNYDQGVLSSRYTTFQTLRSDGTTKFACNSTSGMANTYTNGSYRKGLFLVNTKSGYITLYINSTFVRNNAETPNNKPSANIYICAYNNGGTAAGFSEKQVAASFAGFGLTDTEQLKIFEIIERYLDHKGVGVI